MSEVLAVIASETTPVERALCEGSFHEFIQFAWRTIEPDPFQDGRHIRVLADHLQKIAESQAEGETPRVHRQLIMLPPRHMKSRLVSVFWPAWVWTRWPRIRFLFASHTDNLSLDHAVLSRAVIQSRWYQALWSQRFRLRFDQNVKHYFGNDQGGYRYSTSVGGSVTGQGGDILVVDDAIDTRFAHSEAARKTARDWHDQTWQSRVNDPSRHVKIVLGHRVHEADLAGHILAKGGHGYEVICFPAEAELNHPQRSAFDWRVAEGEPLWPERFSTEALSSLRSALGSYAYAGQYQQRPAPVEGGLIRRSWLRFWQRVQAPELRNAEHLPRTFSRVVIAVDCSFKASEESDFVCAQVWAKQGPNLYLLDQVHGRWGLAETLKQLLALLVKWPDARPCYVEEAANGFAVIEEMKRKVAGIRGVPPSHLGSKVARVQAVSPYIECGNVFFPDPNANGWVSGFVEEALAFPNAAHDDRVDAMTLALIALTKGVEGAGPVRMQV